MCFLSVVCLSLGGMSTMHLKDLVSSDDLHGLGRNEVVVAQSLDAQTSMCLHRNVKSNRFNLLALSLWSWERDCALHKYQYRIHDQSVQTTPYRIQSPITIPPFSSTSYVKSSPTSL